MKIVIVEDEAAIRNGLAGLLPKISPDYEVAGTASDGMEGLAVIREQQPDLVILDIRMTGMDGLTMLRTLRDEGNVCRAVVLSAYSDFDYARTAIELGVESYLLKPVKVKELKAVLSLAEKHIRQEEDEKVRYTPKKAFLSALTGTEEMDAYVKKKLEEEYGLLADGLIGIFIIWLGGEYGKYEEEVGRALTPLGERSGYFSLCTLAREKRQLVLAALYRVQDREKATEYLRKAAAPMLSGLTGGKAVMALAWCGGLKEFHETAVKLCGALDYSLAEGTGKLIVYEERDADVQIFKYPLETETMTKQAVLQSDGELRRCVRNFLGYCRKGRFRPREVKEGCFRYFNTICHTAEEYGRRVPDAAEMSRRMEQILEAVTWDQIREIFDRLLDMLEENIGGKMEEESLLVRKARKMILEYYSQGITLEEIASKLGVSDEYLSTRLKKETGNTFTEIIKNVRMERIKELLVSTNMKLGQIADAAGYSDPKYMSRIFREEVGMLPLEYRKMHL